MEEEVDDKTRAKNLLDQLLGNQTNTSQIKTLANELIEQLSIKLKTTAD